jgi:hypothetical protein
VRTIQTARPRGELKEFVRVFALREMTCSGSGFIQPDIACLEHILAFEFCDPIRIDYVNGESKLVPKIHVAGSQTFPSGCAYFTGRHFAFGIFLKPLASWQLFRIPLATLANDNFDGTRFQAALDTKRLSPRRSWLSVAHELGYFDQMHMVRDFQSLGGDVPSHVIQQSGDLQPWSVASPEHLYDFGEPRSAPVNRPEEYGGTSIRGGTR